MWNKFCRYCPFRDSCKPPLQKAKEKKNSTVNILFLKYYSRNWQEWNLQWTLFGLANALVLSHKISIVTVDCGDLVLNSTASQVKVSPKSWAFAVISCPSMVNLQMNRFCRRKCPVATIFALMDFLVPDGIRISFSAPTAVNFGQEFGPDRSSRWVF